MKLKSFAVFSFFMLALFLISACGNTEKATEQTIEEESKVNPEVKAQETAWEEAKEAYHSVMSASFHSAEEDNLEPLKAKYAELETLSQAWAILEIPEKYQKENIQGALQELEKESAAIAKVVEEGSDEEIKKAIYDLHDIFHKVQEFCTDH